VKFDTEDLYENLPKKSKFVYNRAKILGTLQEGQVLSIGDGDVESPYKAMSPTGIVSEF
jgi:hypothetical protein